MTVQRVRSEWVEDKRILLCAVQAEAMLADFAGSETADVLLVEPRLVTLAQLVTGWARAGGVREDVWRGIESLASALVGSGRSVPRTTPVSARSLAVASTLSGEVTRRRYTQPLKARAAEEGSHDAGAGADPQSGVRRAGERPAPPALDRPSIDLRAIHGGRGAGRGGLRRDCAGPGLRPGFGDRALDARVGRAGDEHVRVGGGLEPRASCEPRWYSISERNSVLQTPIST